MPECDVCFRKCKLQEGQTGFCGGRICSGDRVVAANYGRITSAALDPVEKKPLKRFRPGKMVLSIGSYGCNLRCPYCQNHEISWSKEAMHLAGEAEYASPEEIVKMAMELRNRGNIGIAYTYNEPLIGYEFVRDTAKLAHENGLENILVTNGTASGKVLEEIGPYVDAMNIDLKAFTDRFYGEWIQGDFNMVKDFIEGAIKLCHVELTTLIIPRENDSEEEMRELSAWVAGLKGKVAGKQIPLHVTRFFPRFYVTDRGPTSVETVFRLADVAREKLDYVYTGNM